jgi:16S rRNA (cytosine1402-N4)-methyltransferase
MAIRMATNAELDQLESFVEPAARSLRPGGRIALISFHSLEDRIVKHTLRRLEGRCTCPPSLPECCCHPEQVLRVITSRPLRPSESEIAGNPRARSARLRVAERQAEEG